MPRTRAQHAAPSQKSPSQKVSSQQLPSQKVSGQRMKAQIQPLKRQPSVGASIAAQLQTLIQSGAYKPGERLPGQRQLAEQFGASLAGVREALSVLSAAGLVEARPGRGTLVRSVGDGEPTFDGWLGAVGDASELAELIEARRLLEAFTLREAARRITPEGAAELSAALEDLRAALGDPEAYVQADMQFHLCLARLAGNRVILRLMQAIQAPLTEQLRSSISHLSERGALAENFATHERLYLSVAASDPQQAQAAFDDMLRGALAAFEELAAR
ncbi:GntR domain protein (plasmid) [Deinococcus proteolyticus MRP]|uniref:GntR domain protein n=2 Tax=Deinococcaceae TaxID=183710 RepID=F0RPR5_DEIPM|nr:GntR domain protein [Deinococcus proteolyticus MRP]